MSEQPPAAVSGWPPPLRAAGGGGWARRAGGPAPGAGRGGRRRGREAYYALRAGLCSSRGDFDGLRRRLRRRGRADERRAPVRRPRPDETRPCRAGRADPAARRGRSPEAVPAAWSAEELLRTRTSPRTRMPSARSPVLLIRLSRRGPQRLSRRTRRPAAGARCTTCGDRPRLAPPRGRAVERRWREPAVARGRSCSSATCRARWPPTRGCCSSTCSRGGGPAAGGGVRVRHAADAGHPRAGGRDPDRALERAAGSVSDWSAGRGSATRSPS